MPVVHQITRDGLPLSFTSVAIQIDGQPIDLASTDFTIALHSPADTIAPIVLSILPANGATGVPLSVKPTVTFSEPMDPATITESTVLLSPVADHAHVAYDQTTRTVTVSPHDPLTQDTLHTIGIKGGANGVKDVSGNPLAADVMSTFRTAATVVVPPVHGDDPIKEAEHQSLLALLPASEANGTTRFLISASSADIISDDFTADWIRVEGTLRITGGTLRVGTIVVLPGGRFEMSGGTLEFFGAVTDPFALGVGLIAHGTTRINGALKVPYSFANSALTAGQTQISVSDATGWQVGDKLVVAGTSLGYKVIDDDVRTIAAIDGNTVTLDSPLTFAHVLVDDREPVIINVTRSVTIRTAEGSPSRGHVMLMHNPDIAVSYAAFERLGRTDKTRAITSPDGLGGGLDNPIGRYSLHFHRTGFNYNTTPITVIGCAIDDSPGWGTVIHESYANVYDTVAYNVVGGAFVGETGKERGTFTRCVAVRGRGNAGTTGYVPQGQALSEGVANVDFARDGIGFWTEGGFISIVDCIAIGCNAAGIFSNPGAHPKVFPKTALSPAEIDEIQATHWSPYLFTTLKGVRVGEVPQIITGNFVYGSHAPLHIWGSSFYALKDHHSQVNNNTFIQGQDGGPAVVLGYCHRIEFNNNRWLGNGTWKGSGVGHTGISVDMRYIDNYVVGFETGINLPTENDLAAYNGNLVQGGYYDNAVTNLRIQNTQQNRPRTIEMVSPEFGTRAKWNVEMSPSFFSYNFEAAYKPNTGALPDLTHLWTSYGLGAASVVKLNGTRLYFDVQADAFSWDLLRFPEHAGKTTADLATEGKIVGGVALPAGVQTTVPKIRGVLIA